MARVLRHAVIHLPFVAIATMLAWEKGTPLAWLFLAVMVVLDCAMVALFWVHRRKRRRSPSLDGTS